jgi:hypothetical protein
MFNWFDQLIHCNGSALVQWSDGPTSAPRYKMDTLSLVELERIKSPPTFMGHIGNESTIVSYFPINRTKFSSLHTSRSQSPPTKGLKLNPNFTFDL